MKRLLLGIVAIITVSILCSCTMNSQNSPTQQTMTTLETNTVKQSVNNTQSSNKLASKRCNETDSHTKKDKTNNNKTTKKQTESSDVKIINDNNHIKCLSNAFFINLNADDFKILSYRHQECKSNDMNDDFATIIPQYFCKSNFKKSHYDDFIKLLNSSGYKTFDMLDPKNDVEIYNVETGFSIKSDNVVNAFHYFKTQDVGIKRSIKARREFVILIEYQDENTYNAYFFVY